MGGGARTLALVAIATALGAWGWDWDDSCCYPTEFVTRQAGDAVQVNKNIQMINPWPHYVKNRKIDLDGHRASIAMRRYQANQVIPPANLAAQMPQNNNASSTPAPAPELQQ
jgi:hypothetical protein